MTASLNAKAPCPQFEITLEIALFMNSSVLL